MAGRRLMCALLRILTTSHPQEGETCLRVPRMRIPCPSHLHLLHALLDLQSLVQIQLITNHHHQEENQELSSIKPWMRCK